MDKHRKDIWLVKIFALIQKGFPLEQAQEENQEGTS